MLVTLKWITQSKSYFSPRLLTQEKISASTILCLHHTCAAIHNHMHERQTCLRAHNRRMFSNRNFATTFYWLVGSGILQYSLPSWINLGHSSAQFFLGTRTLRFRLNGWDVNGMFMVISTEPKSMYTWSHFVSFLLKLEEVLLCRMNVCWGL